VIKGHRLPIARLGTTGPGTGISTAGLRVAAKPGTATGPGTAGLGVAASRIGDLSLLAGPAASPAAPRRRAGAIRWRRLARARTAVRPRDLGPARHRLAARTRNLGPARHRLARTAARPRRDCDLGLASGPRSG
jgi:hypothetical protein